MKWLVGAVSATVLLPFLLLGGLLSVATRAESRQQVPAAASVGDLPAARPFAGPDGYVDDPTSRGRITRRMLHTYQEVQRVFGGWPWGVHCWDPHTWNLTSDHPKGRACDFTVGSIDRFPDAADRATGWRLAYWLQANAGPLGVSYIIWNGHIWNPRYAAAGWRPYNGAGIYNPRSPTGGHYDHVHLSVA